MAKVTWGPLPERDDPIFSGGLQIHFSPQSTRSTGATPKSTDGGPQPAPNSSAASQPPSNYPAAEPLTKLREDILGRPLTPAEKALLDVTGF